MDYFLSNFFLSNLKNILIQSFAEAFPISSSLHLKIFCSNSLNFTFLNIAASAAFFAASFSAIKRHAKEFFIKKNYKIGIKISLFIFPTLICGFFIKYYKVIDLNNFNYTFNIIINFIFGLFLIYCSVIKSTKTENELSIINFFQAGLIATLAFVPGVSRFGITFCSLKIFSMKNENAVFFALISGIPVTFFAGASHLQKISINAEIFLILLISSLISFAAVKFCLILKNHFYLFGIYRMIFSLISLLYVLK